MAVCHDLASTRRGPPVIALAPRFSLLALATLAAALVLAAGATEARSASYRPCTLTGTDARPRSGAPTYNLGLKQMNTRCATATKVMKAFHACRPRLGSSCTRRVLSNWTCTGRKTSSIPTTFYGTFTCRWGARRVTSSYQQNTPSQ